ncbi:MAG: TonB-dependent receptor [Steroidobacteraceae bacterium]
MNTRFGPCAPLAVLALAAPALHAQQASTVPTSHKQTVIVYGTADQDDSAVRAEYQPGSVDLGPLGDQSVANVPQSVTVVPQNLIINQQARTVDETLSYLPSVSIRDQQGFEVSRPQSRGFEGSVVQNTRIDGLNAIGTTGIAAENLSSIQVLNGLAGSLYGPQTPAGVFNYVLERPTDVPLLRFDEGYDSESVFTEHLEGGDRTGPVAFRVNAVRGDGETYAPQSSTNRTLLSAAVDFHIGANTVIETNYSYYDTEVDGTPGSIVYFGGKSTFLPPAIDPTRLGYGQPGAGTDLMTHLGVVKLVHRFNDDWTLQIGGLYESAIRNLFGITNRLIDDTGDYTVTKNFTAVPSYTIGSNSAYLNGHFDWLGTRNDVTIGTNGFVNGQYNYRNSIAVLLGSANLAGPQVLPPQPTPPNGGMYHSGTLRAQTIIAGDTMHFNSQLAVQAVLSTSFLSSHSYSATGSVKAEGSDNGSVSPTVSVMYRPIPALLTYATFAQSVEQGDEAPTGTVNANEYLAPYHDREYEIGAKYTVTPKLLVTIDGFRMTRPLAATDALTNVFYVAGTQRNWGAEVFVQGDVTPDVSLFGGVTYLDSRLIGTGNPATNELFVVGVPGYKGDIAVDFHPRFAHGFALTAALHVEGRRAATNTNNSFAPAFGTFDIGGRYTTTIFTHRVVARFQVINVTDTRYFVAVADGNIAGSPGANTAYSGTPRTYEANIAFDL